MTKKKKCNSSSSDEKCKRGRRGRQGPAGLSILGPTGPVGLTGATGPDGDTLCDVLHTNITPCEGDTIFLHGEVGVDPSPTNPNNVAVVKTVGVDVSLALTPTGTGAFLASEPDGTAAGGNPRGDNAVDLQMARIASILVASGDFSVISGGISNIASGNTSTVGGGNGNIASGNSSTVGGGNGNATLGNGSTAGGGTNNVASGVNSTVGGGVNNVASGTDAATIAGGRNNSASSDQSTVGGGSNNSAGGQYSTVGGGNGNIASGFASTVGGGSNNSAGGDSSVVGGGELNIASGGGSTIPGGTQNSASGFASFAAGTNSSAIGDGTFAWNSDTTSSATAVGPNEVVYNLLPLSNYAPATPNTFSINGKLTVTGAIDPTQVLLSGGDKRFGATDPGPVYIAPFEDSSAAVQIRRADNSNFVTTWNTTSPTPNQTTFGAVNVIKSDGSSIDALSVNVTAGSGLAAKFSGASVSVPDTGVPSERFGQGSNATATNAVAFGIAAQATADDALAVGPNATADGVASVSIGSGASAGGNDGSVSLGPLATSTGVNQLTIRLGTGNIIRTELNTGGIPVTPASSLIVNINGTDYFIPLYSS